MAGVSTLEATVQLKSPDKFYNIVKSQNQRTKNDYIDNIPDIEFVGGDLANPGSVKTWKATLEGKEEEFQERLEVDDANKTLTCVAVGGNVRELYKSFRSSIKPQNDGTAKITIEYEKVSENVPPPNKYLQYVINYLNKIDDNSLSRDI